MPLEELRTTLQRQGSTSLRVCNVQRSSRAAVDAPPLQWGGFVQVQLPLHRGCPAARGENRASRPADDSSRAAKSVHFTRVPPLLCATLDGNFWAVATTTGRRRQTTPRLTPSATSYQFAERGGNACHTQLGMTGQERFRCTATFRPFESDIVTLRQQGCDDSLDESPPPRVPPSGPGTARRVWNFVNLPFSVLERGDAAWCDALRWQIFVAGPGGWGPKGGPERQRVPREGRPVLRPATLPSLRFRRSERRRPRGDRHGAAPLHFGCTSPNGSTTRGGGGAGRALLQR